MVVTKTKLITNKGNTLTRKMMDSLVFEILLERNFLSVSSWYAYTIDISSLMQN